MTDLLLCGPINNYAAKKLISELQTFSSTGNAVILTIHSEGGDEGCARAIAGAITMHRNLGRRIDTVGLGDIQSAAVLVFAAGQHRQLSKFAKVMVHESSTDTEGNSSDMRELAKQMEADEKFWCELMQVLTGTDSKVWLKLHSDETYLSPEEALKLNLATELI